MLPYKRLTLEERRLIEEGLKKGHSYYSIALSLKRSPQGIGNEIRQYSVNGIYNAVKSHEMARAVRHAALPDNRINLSEEEIRFIESRREEGSSFDEIAKLTGIKRYALMRRYRRQISSGHTLPRPFPPSSELTIFDEMETLKEQVKILTEILKDVTRELQNVKQNK